MTQRGLTLLGHCLFFLNKRHQGLCVLSENRLNYYNSRGTYTVYGKDALDCGIVTRQFAFINLINAITPNDDGFNDAIDYSELLTKEDPVFRIFDRYGAEVFRGTPANRFRWDGKTSPTRHVSTGTYWYILQWREFGSPTTFHYTSWLLVKNRMGNIFKE